MLREELITTKLQDLKLEVKRKFGRNILASSDCLLLAEDVFNETGESISFNTVRRSFNILKSDNQPSLHTLDTFARYCGFSSFDEFYSLDLSIKKETPNKDLLHYIILLFKDIKLNINEDPTYLQLVRLTCKYLENHSYLMDLFQKKIAKTVNGQEIYFEYFVNVDRLNTFYGNGLKYYLAEKKTKEAQMFGLSLLCFKGWLAHNKKEVDKNHNKITNHNLQASSDPILWGRYFASQLYYQDVNNLDKTTVFANARQYHSIAKLTTGDSGCMTCFELVMSEALLLVEEFSEALFYIGKFREKEGSCKLRFGCKNLHLSDTMDLLEAIAYAGIGKKHKAKILINKINTQHFFWLSKQYYTILYLRLKLNFFHSNSMAKQLDALVELTGFKKLGEASPTSN